MTRMILATICSAALIAACTPPAEEPAAAPAPTPPPATETPVAEQPAENILTSEGFGPLRIGMTTAEITAALGPDANPDAVGGPDPESCDQFRPERAPEGMLLMTEQGRLTRITLSDESDITTDRGFAVGDPGAGVKSAYGDAAIVTPHKYQPAPAEYITVWTTGGGAEYVQDPAARGLVYEVGGDGNVQAIHAGGPSIQYVEGCL